MIKYRKILSVLSMMCLSVIVLAACDGESDEPTTDEQQVTDTSDESLDTFIKHEVTDGMTNFYVIENPGEGPTLSFGTASGMNIIEIEEDGLIYAFKDSNGSGILDPWDDWRLDPVVRAQSLAPYLSFEQITGMMLFSPHMREIEDGPTEDQISWVAENYMRNILNAASSDVWDNVTWVNAMQALAEAQVSDSNPYIPINISSDPRSAAGIAVTNTTRGISRWPGPLGMAATHDIVHMENFAQMVSREYRALGITMALDPQIDLATEPRWARVGGTYGEDAAWATALGQAYLLGFEYTPGYGRGGTEAVGTIVKHAVGDGQNEGGRGAHTVAGQYAIFPGDNFDTHFQHFADVIGVGATGVMPAYPILLDGEGNPLFNDRRGAGYDTHLMNTLLRESLRFEGIVVTDWGIANETLEHNGHLWRGTSHGVIDLTQAERMFELLLTGTDQFGGVSDVVPVIEAFDIWQDAYEAGELPIDSRMRAEETAVRILNTKFNVGLFDNPFVDLDHSLTVVGSEDKRDASWAAQLASVVMLKNDDATITPSTTADWENLTVYVPYTQHIGTANWTSGPDGGFSMTPPSSGPSLTIEVLAQYFATVVTDEVQRDADDNIIAITAPDLSDVDVVLVGMRSPDNGGQFSSAGRAPEDPNVWYPLSLQWRPYTADGPYVRRESISGNMLEDGTQENRSYFGETSRIGNEADLDAFERAVAAVAATGRDDLQLITVLMAENPVVPHEIYEESNAIVVGFRTSHQSLIEVALGLHEASGRLPITFPADMDAVERQLEDLADTDPFVDSQGNVWEFGFGLNFSGPID